MMNDTALILASCLDAIEQQGRLPEECMAQHPEQRLALSELLPVAQALRSAPAVIPSLDFRMDARERLLTRLPARLPARCERRAARGSKRILSVSLGLAILLVVSQVTSVVTASARALPNDVLYPLKRTIEHVRLALAADSLRGELRLVFAAQRLDEVERLIDLGRGADAAVAIDDFAAQMHSAVSITQTMPDTAVRAALAARVAESVKSSDAVLFAAQARLPESVQVAVARARALLAEREDNLRSTPPPAMPSLTPDRAPAHIPPHIPTHLPPGIKPPGVLPLIPAFEPPRFPTPIPRGGWPRSRHLH